MTPPPPTSPESAPPAQDPPALEPPPSGPWLGALRRVARMLAAVPRPLALGLLALWSAWMWRLSDSAIDIGPDVFVMAVLSNGAHAPLFGIWGLLLTLGITPRPVPADWPRPGRFVALAVPLATMAWGLIDEWHQARVPGRDSSPLDIATDLVAVGCVLWIASYLGRADATERGLRGRLWAGIGACLAVAAVGALG